MEDDFQIHAGGKSCIRRRSTKQPIAGTLVFNSFHAEPSVNILSETISTIIHEVFHTMFFERTLFRNYPFNRKGQTPTFINRFDTYQIRSDNFIDFAREHFNCRFLFFFNFKVLL
jgi:hypothetical protein